MVRDGNRVRRILVDRAPSAGGAIVVAFLRRRCAESRPLRGSCAPSGPGITVRPVFLGARSALEARTQGFGRARALRSRPSSCRYFQVYSPVSCPSSKTSFTAYCPTGSTAVMATFSLPSTSTSCPGPCPFTSADGECTRRYSNGNSKRLPSAKLTSSIREVRRRRISVGMRSDMRSGRSIGNDGWTPGLLQRNIYETIRPAPLYSRPIFVHEGLGPQARAVNGTHRYLPSGLLPSSCGLPVGLPGPHRCS